MLHERTRYDHIRVVCSAATFAAAVLAAAVPATVFADDGAAAAEPEAAPVTRGPLAGGTGPAPETPEAPEAPKPNFYKGELTSIGPQMQPVQGNRVGAVVGWRTIAFTHYAMVSPLVDLKFRPGGVPIEFGVWAPLNIELIDLRIDPDSAKASRFGTKNAGRIRAVDWNEWQDYARILRYFTIGRKEDRIYLNLNQTAANTLGHGALISRYIPNFDLNTAKVSAALDMYNDWAGFQLYTDDVLRANLAGALLFVKPLAWLSNPVARSLSIGGSFVGTRNAPLRLAPDRIDERNRRFIVERSAAVYGWDVDAEVKVFKNETADIKVYADYAQLIPQAASSAVYRTDPPPAGAPLLVDRRFEGGWGASGGMLARFNFGTPLQAARLRLEARAFNQNYQPGYFDALYELQRLKFVSDLYPVQPRPADERVVGATPTKYAQVFDASRPRRLYYGGMLEFSYAVVGYFGLTLALEDSTFRNYARFLAHIEVPATKWFTLSASYYKWSFNGYSDLFNLAQGNGVLVSSARIHPLPLLYFNLMFQKQLWPSVKYAGLFESAYDARLDIEISWTWGERL